MTPVQKSILSSLEERVEALQDQETQSWNDENISLEQLGRLQSKIAYWGSYLSNLRAVWGLKK